MVRRATIRVAVLVVIHAILANGLWAQLKSGIVVEEVAKNSESEKAGLKEGDVLLGWSRGEAKGEIDSPFDLSNIETEQEPRGAVTLEGLRGTEKQSWMIGPDDWGLKTRPSLSDSLLAICSEGRELAAAGKPLEAAQRYEAAANQVVSNQDQALPSWLPAWFLVRAAEVLAQKKTVEGSRCCLLAGRPAGRRSWTGAGRAAAPGVG
jgi:hypothetical protein